MTAVTDEAIEAVDFTFGDPRLGTVKKNGDVLVSYDNSAFYDNAKKAGYSKPEIKQVFKFVKSYNEAFVKHASGDAVGFMKKDKEIKRVVGKAGYGMGGSVAATIQKSKTKPVGKLGSGKTIDEPYISLKIKDASLPHKDFMKEQVVMLVKKLK